VSTGFAVATVIDGIEHTWAMLGFGLLSARVELPTLFLGAECRLPPRETHPALMYEIVMCTTSVRYFFKNANTGEF
jgi:hypothetical protein